MGLFRASYPMDDNIIIQDDNTTLREAIVAVASYLPNTPAAPFYVALTVEEAVRSETDESRQLRECGGCTDED